MSLPGDKGCHEHDGFPAGGCPDAVSDSAPAAGGSIRTPILLEAPVAIVAAAGIVIALILVLLLREAGGL